MGEELEEIGRVVVETEIRLSWADRIRVLFGRKITTRQNIGVKIGRFSSGAPRLVSDVHGSDTSVERFLPRRPMPLEFAGRS